MRHARTSLHCDPTFVSAFMVWLAIAWTGTALVADDPAGAPADVAAAAAEVQDGAQAAPPALPDQRAVAQPALQTAIDSILASDLQAHVAFLADDRLEGRETGTTGGQAAAQYLAEQLAALHLKPLGPDNSYTQPFGDNCRNVLGMLEGSDPQLKEEVIVVGAHYDHLGYGGTPQDAGRKDVYNGANDNASGVAGVLELADAFSKLSPPPRRSVLFALWDGEEKGLLGARHFISSPLVPLDHIVFVANLEMIGRLRDNHVVVWGARSAYGLRRLVCSHNAAQRLTLDFRHAVINRADHYPFLEQGIPIFCPFADMHPEWHQPNDELQFIDADGMQRITRFSFEVLCDIANRPDRLRFRETVRAESESDPYHPVPPRPLNADDPLLPRGVTGRCDDAEPDALIVMQVATGSPADQAGLEPDDRICQINSQDISPQLDLTRALAMSSGPLNMLVERKGQLHTTELGTAFGAGSAASFIDSVRVLAGHTGEVRCVVFSPDGQLLASGGFDRTARLWNLADGREIATLAGHNDLVNSLAFSLDSKRLVTGSFDKSVRIWDVATGTEQARLEAESPVYSVAFDLAGALIAAGCGDNTVTVWDVATREVRTHIAAHTRTVECVAFGTGNATLASGSWDATVRLWDPATWKESATINAGVELRSLAFSPQGGTLAIAGGPSGEVKLWNVTTCRVDTMLYGLSTWVNAVAFDPAGQLVAAGGRDRRVVVWDAVTGRKRLIIQGHPDEIWSVAFAPDGKTLASGSRDQTIKLWDVSSLRVPPAVAATDAVSHQPATDAAAASATPAKEPAAETSTGEYSLYAGWVDPDRMVFSPDGRFLATHPMSSAVNFQLWDLAGGNPVSCNIDTSVAGMRWPQFTSSGRWCVVPPNFMGPQAEAGERGTALLDLHTSPPGSAKITLGDLPSVRWSMLAAGGRWYAAPTTTGIRIWDLQAADPSSSSVVVRSPARIRHTPLAISTDGQWLIAGRRLLDLAGAVAAELEVELAADEVEGARVFSPTDRWALCGDRLHRLDSPDPTSPVTTLSMAPGALQAVFSREERLLIVGGKDKIQVWDLTAPNIDASVRAFDGPGGPSPPMSFPYLMSFALSSDNRWLILSSPPGCFLYDLSANGSSAPRKSLDKLRPRVFNGIQRWLMLADERELRLADLRSDDPTTNTRLLASLGQNRFPVLSGDGRWLAISNREKSSEIGEKRFELWDLRSDDPAASPLVLLPQWTHGTFFSPDSRWLFTVACHTPGSSPDTPGNVSHNGVHKAHLWDLTAENMPGSEFAFSEKEGTMSMMGISPDGRWVVTYENGQAIARDMTVFRDKAAAKPTQSEPKGE